MTVIYIVFDIYITVNIAVNNRFDVTFRSNELESIVETFERVKLWARRHREEQGLKIFMKGRYKVW